MTVTHRPSVRILIVEDDPEVLSAVADTLSHQGYCVDCATDGPKALALMRITPLPDVVLLDLMMPRGGGSEFLREIRSVPALASLPVILMTGSETIPDDFQDLQASALLLKPFSAKDLLGTVGLHVPIR